MEEWALADRDCCVADDSHGMVTRIPPSSPTKGLHERTSGRITTAAGPMLRTETPITIRHVRNPMSNKADKMFATVAKWANSLGFELKLGEPDEPAWEWVGVMSPNTTDTTEDTASSTGLLVGYNSEGYERLVLQATVPVSEEHRELLKALGPRSRDSFIADLYLKLLKHPLEVSFNADTTQIDPADILRSLQFSTLLIDETIQRSHFISRFTLINTSLVVMGTMFSKLQVLRNWP